MEGSIIADRYIINGVVGSGGMAIVYKGYDRDTGEEVAIKVLRSEFMQDEAYVRRFEKESQIAIKYSHKNIVRTIEAGCKDGRHYIVMEYVTGKTLKDHIAEQGRLKPPEVVRIGRQICDALFYAHSHQLIHRDIKPQNILLSGDGVVKVADFGIAKAPETATVTISGSNVLGSVHYISPEQARGGITDEKTDIYSIGIVLYEMVTGVVPFTGDTPVAVALKHLQDMPKPPREIVPEMPKALELVILKAISKEQSVRYDNAREMARDLERSILEPEGSYIKIKQPDEVEGTRPMHPIKVESLPPQQFSSYSNTGPSRRPVPPRPEEYWRKQRKPPKVINVLIAVLLAVVLLGGAYIGIKAFLDASAPSYRMPYLINEDIDTAKTQLGALKIVPTIQEEANENIPKGTVIGQDPEKDMPVNPGDTVTLTVSSGQRQAEVPDVVGYTLTNAKAAIESVGLKVGDVRTDTSSNEPKDTVTKQDPAGKTMLAIKGNVNIWISTPKEPTVQKMPNLVGKTKDDAVSMLISMKVDQKNIKVLPKKSNYVAGIVDSQTPDVGITLDNNTIIDLYVSNGTPPGYEVNYTMSFDVTDDGTDVKIDIVDDGVQTNVYEHKYDKGHQDVDQKLTSMTLGDKTLIYYFNGKEVKRETVTFQ